MDALDRRMRLLRRLAWATLALALAVTSLSAFIRLSRAGLDCTPWPVCYAQRAGLPGEGLQALDDGKVTAARIAHRISASSALLLVVALVLLTLARRPLLWPQGRLVLALLLLVLLLSALGWAAGASRAAPVVLGNLLGGFILAALAWRLVQATGTSPCVMQPLRKWTWLALTLLLTQLALGALAAASQQVHRCSGDLPCQLHAGFSAVVLAALLVAGALAWRRGARAAGGAVIALAMLQAATGLAQLAGPLPLALGLAHNILGALLLAAVAGLLPARVQPLRSVEIHPAPPA